MNTYFKSLKFRILFYCFSFATVILSIIIAVCFVTFNTLLKQNSINTTNYNLRIAMDNISTRVSSIVNITNWCTVNNNIIAFASAHDLYPNDLKFKTLSAHTALKNQIYSLGVDEYINKIIIHSENGYSIQSGSIYGDKNDIPSVISMPYFDTLLNAPTIQWTGIWNEPFQGTNSDTGIPIIRNIPATYQQASLGWVYVSIDTNIITDFLTRYDFDEGSNLYIMIGDKMYDISDRKSFIEMDSSFFDFSNAKTYKDAKYIEIDNDGTTSTAIYYTAPVTGWTIIQTLSDYPFTLQNKVYTYLLFFVAGGIFLLTALIFVTVSQSINPPIKRILTHIDQISSGDFSYNSKIESKDEIGHIGIGINKMALDIQKLIDDRIRNEKTRKNLELKMLQNQINPHFLYNTLNSIKWMATIQKVPGIAEIVTSLAILLKNIAKGTDEFITIEEEISLLNEYCTIQQYRSGGLFHVNYHFNNPKYRNCKIIKFTLQPIVENSIFHGIEPKGGGIIDIYITRPAENILRVSVKDDGIGLPPEKIERVMNDTTTRTKTFNNIGIKNVDERIKLTFGEQYGIQIDSKLGEYTSVSIELPFLVDLPPRNEVECE